MVKHFSMEKILDWRMDLEEAARLNVSQLNARLHSENHQLQSLINENIKVKSENMHAVHIQSLRYNDYYKNVIDERIVQQKNRMDLTRADIQSAQEKLLRTHTDRRAMEKLKEKELTAHYQAELRREQMQLDELATMNYKRRVL